jgi:thiamine-monophosphate kinase
VDEFEAIARLFRPLTGGASEALDLLDDAAVIPARPGFDLIVTKDAMVEGVHFRPDDPPDFVARKLLRVNLSDLAAKGAEPYAYFLALAWPPAWGEDARTLFAQGLAEDQARYGLKLFGGDTVSTPGPLTLSATLLGWTPAGRMVRRSGARAGDLVLVTGVIGDGWLGLAAAEGRLDGLTPNERRHLLQRYQLPDPRLELREGLRNHANAAADVSDGLLADLGHIAKASGLGAEVDLERLPCSPAGAAWLARQPDEAAARAKLAAGGDDYEIVLTAGPEAVADLTATAAACGLPLTVIGRMVEGAGVAVAFNGMPVAVEQTGWRHA